MINTLVYTYYTDNGNNLKNNYPNLEMFKSQWSESYESVLKTNPYFAFLIFTDKEGQDVAKECCPTADIIIIDYESYDFDKRLWCFGKLISYDYLSRNNIPFLHIDQDVELLKRLNDEMLNADILTEMTRQYIYQPSTYRPRTSFVDEVGLLIEPMPSFVVCSGLLGGNKIDVFSKQFEIIERDLDTKDLPNIFLDHMVAFEEVLLTRLIIDENLTIVGINKKLTAMCDYYIHYQGDRKFNKEKFKRQNKQNNNNLRGKSQIAFQDKHGVIHLKN